MKTHGGMTKIQHTVRAWTSKADLPRSALRFVPAGLLFKSAVVSVKL